MKIKSFNDSMNKFKKLIVLQALKKNGFDTTNSVYINSIISEDINSIYNKHINRYPKKHRGILYKMRKYLSDL